VLYVRVVDPFKASYGVDSALYAVSQLAQTTMRSELGRITLDKVGPADRSCILYGVHIADHNCILSSDGPACAYNQPKPEPSLCGPLDWCQPVSGPHIN
jgi:hypothetical protein